MNKDCFVPKELIELRKGMGKDSNGRKGERGGGGVGYMIEKQDTIRNCSKGIM